MENFIPTEIWMRKKYDEMNEKLFNNSLGDCDFSIFTSGRGSQGKTLGFFTLKGKMLKADRYSRKMFIDTHEGRIYIDDENFATYCYPEISLNGNYSGDENSFLATLVHEMCHYYTYMRGYFPKQAHGPEFRQIANYVSLKSNNLFNIKRIANAEVVSGLKLNDKMQSINDKRRDNKFSSTYIILMYRKNDDVYLATSTNEKLIDDAKYTLKYGTEKVVVFKDKKLFEFLYNLGYRTNMRTLRYWNVSGEGWLNDVCKIEDKMVYTKKDIGIDESIMIKNIISEVIENYVNDTLENDVIEITPNMNLGIYTPLDYE